MALVVLALLFFSGILTYQIGRTAAAAAESTREANRANQESIVAQEMLGLARSLLFGTYGEADPETERAAKALEIFEDEIGRIQMDVKQTPLVQAKIAESIGAVYVALGRYRQAELLFSKSLEIRRDYLGREHIETVESILRLADLHKALGSIKEAEPLYQDALGGIVRNQRGRLLWFSASPDGSWRHLP